MNIAIFKEKLKQELPESDLNPVSKAKLACFKNEFDGIPDDYLEYLQFVGAGSLGECYFSIYGGPLDPDEIYDPETAKELSNYIFIGDDFSGWMLGYDKTKKPYELAFFNHNERCPLNEQERKSLVGFLNYELFVR